MHISRLKAERVDRTEDVVQSGDDVWVKVLEINDVGTQKRISLSMKHCSQIDGSPIEVRETGNFRGSGSDAIPEEGSIHKGRVCSIKEFGCFVEVGRGYLWACARD